MIGVLAGDIIGSIYEGDVNNIKTKEFELFVDKSHFTDDTTLTIATIDKLLNHKTYREVYRDYARQYPEVGFGGQFKKWFKSDVQTPYGSWGNGSAMRVCPVGWLFNHPSLVINEATESAIVTHGHPEGIRAAQCIAMCVFLAKNKFTKGEIEKYVTENFKYDLSFDIDEYRKTYKFDVSAAGTVPVSIKSFLVSTSFEDAIRIAISMGGDSDTIAAIVGGIAEAYYGTIPAIIAVNVLTRIPDSFKVILNKFYDSGINFNNII